MVFPFRVNRTAIIIIICIIFIFIIFTCISFMCIICIIFMCSICIIFVCSICIIFIFIIFISTIFIISISIIFISIIFILLLFLFLLFLFLLFSFLLFLIFLLHSFTPYRKVLSPFGENQTEVDVFPLEYQNIPPLIIQLGCYIVRFYGLLYSTARCIWSLYQKHSRTQTSAFLLTPESESISIFDHDFCHIQRPLNLRLFEHRRLVSRLLSPFKFSNELNLAALRMKHLFYNLKESHPLLGNASHTLRPI